MKSIYRYISILAGAALFAGCSSFLDVNPKGEVLDADMFSSAEGYEDALYGVYSELSTDNYLYAAYMHWIPEACSQNVYATDYILGSFALADWDTQGPSSYSEHLWTDSYEVINHLNNIIIHAEAAGTEAFEYSGLYYGEALALRALMHFELVRFYGVPFWAPDELKKTAIPYVTTYSFDITPFSSLDEVYEYIIADLKLAESMMSADEELIPAERTNSATGFTDSRITHMNLYAVKALLARVYWTMGDIDTAASYAKKVIDSGKFSFRPASAFVQPDNGTLDMNETIFGVYSTACQSLNATKYGLSGSSSSSVTLASDWQGLYKDGASSSRTDYRVNAWFSDGCLIKLVNSLYYSSTSSSYTGDAILGVNILRLPEMYFIMVEANMDSNPTVAKEYYNTFLLSRGRDELSESGVVLDEDELFNERRREMYGEGFTWHDMKRLGKDIVSETGTVLSGSLPSNYTIPIPDAETEVREDLS